MFETISLEIKNRIGILTLNRPQKLNAINHRMSQELPKAWEAIKSNTQIAGVIVTGAGDRALCTGFDVSDVALEQTEVDGVRFTAFQNRCWKPVVTAVNGMVTGGGLHFVSDSDIVIASNTATFFDTHVNVGLVAGLEPIGLARRMALEPVLRMALTGKKDRMDATRAKALGLVSEVVPLHELLPRAETLVSLILKNSPTAVAETKRAIWESLNLGIQDALAQGWTAIDRHAGHPDIEEGARAFREKRDPQWTGGTTS